MAENSKIEWTTHTFNPWRGCTKVSEGCRNCYAETLSGRNPKVLGVWGPNGTRVVAAQAAWKEPVKWDRAAKKAGERHQVFCASLADVFEGPDTMPADSWDKVTQARRRMGQLILDTPHLDWLLLTKRPANILPIAADMWVRFGGPTVPLPPNVWIGTSVENQQAADERIPHLIKMPAAVRFLSMEPLLGSVDLTNWLWADMRSDGGGRSRLAQLHWVIVGGESGRDARPMHPAWARSLRDQCQAAGVPFFFKQHGEYTPVMGQIDGMAYMVNAVGSPSGPKVADSFTFPDGQEVIRVGKKAAGRLLDGRTWDEFPASPGQ